MSTRRMIILLVLLQGISALAIFLAGISFGSGEVLAQVLSLLSLAMIPMVISVEIVRSRKKVVLIGEDQLKMQSYIVLAKVPDEEKMSHELILLRDLRRGEYLLGDFVTYPPKGYRETRKGERVVLLPEKWETWPCLPSFVPGQW